MKTYGIVYAGEHKEHVIGKSFALSIGFYRDTFGLSAEMDDLHEHRTRVATEFYREHIGIFEGVTEVLADLQRQNLKLALATSSVSRLITPFLARHDLNRYFDTIVTGEMVKNGKPHPDIYLQAASQLGVEPQNCLVIEDALAGLQAGRGAGCQTVAIPDARWIDPQKFRGEADFVVENIEQIAPIVRQLREPKEG